MKYRGTLEVAPDRGDGGLAVELALDDRTLTVLTNGDVIGTYPIDEVDVSRVGSDRFDVRVGSEQLVFTAEDAIRFSYEAIPYLDASRSIPHHLVNRVRAWWSSRMETTTRTEPAPTVEPPTTGPPVPAPAMRASGGPVAAATRAALTDVRNLWQPDHDEPESDPFDPAARFEPARSEPASGFEPAGTHPVARSERGVSRAEEPTPGWRTPEEDRNPVSETPGSAARSTSGPAPSTVRTCLGIRSDGKPCGSSMLGPNGFCFTHDPHRALQRRVIQEQTTRAAERVRRSSFENLDDVVARLERAVAEVHEGRLDPQAALAMASLAHAMIDTIELAKSSEPKDRSV